MDPDSYPRLVEPHRAELHAHCYRMLGSLQDAEDALQETLLGAWRGLPGFEGRSSLRSWLFTIATHACLRALEARKRRALPMDLNPPADPRGSVGEPLAESLWVEPYPDGLLHTERRESVELAFIVALQHLLPTQRAALLLCEVLGFSAREAAAALDTTLASINSALQRARQRLRELLPASPPPLTDEHLREQVDRFVAAWDRRDVAAIVAMLAEDATFNMPPLPAWFRGREDIRTFIATRIFATPWRFVALRAGGHPAMAGYQLDADSRRYRLAALNVLTFRGDEVAALTAFLDPSVLARFGLPQELPPDER